MAKQTLALGTVAKDQVNLRTAFEQINSNFTELYENSANSSQPTNTATAAISSGALVVDLSKAIIKVTLTENVTSITFTNAPASGKSSSTLVVFTQDGTGGRTVAGSGFLTASGLGLSVSSTLNTVSLISFLAYDSSNIIAFNVGEDYQ